MAFVVLVSLFSFLGLLGLNHGLREEVFVPIEPNAVPEDFDCPMRQLAFEFATTIQPFLSSDHLQEIADALNGAKESLNKSCVTVPSDWSKKHRTPMIWDDLKKNNINLSPSIYVDYDKGNDNNDGTKDSPLKHLDYAIIVARKKYGSQIYKKIILRKGKHYLRKTINITTKDNNLLITNYNNELVEISGGTPLKCQWTVNTKGLNKNIYQCKITDNTITDIYGIRINSTRAIRARYPNGNPEVYPCGFCSTNKAKSWVPPVCENKPDMEYYPQTPKRDSSESFQYYQLGTGGCCNQFVPDAGYWCGNHTSGGGAFTYLIPSGLVYDSNILPHAPYKDVTGGVVQTWRPGHWSSWMFLLDNSKYDAKNNKMIFKKGGFQGARGNSNGDEFFVENIMEELDYPTEWFFNTTEKVLYYYNNQTQTNDPNSLVFEATNLKVLVNYTGTMDNPAKNHEIRGMTFRDTQYTYLDPHGMPSGGDWGLERTGALYLDGVENISISSNILTRLDGNAISINRYARDVTVYRNEIVWNGDNAVSAWGDTENISFPDGTTMGYDGTNGNQPRGVHFTQNFVHEIGIWEKQSSMWFQAKSCSNVLEGNIFFNGPRAGINFNDGFGGNSTLTKNLLFNTCRESGDHGPFNSWDRQVYVTKVRNGSPSDIKEYDHIYKNFMIANYNSQEAIDNDDGSCYYDTHENFFVYSGNGMKNDFGGHDNIHHSNIYGYIGHCFGICSQIEGHRDEFYNNTCIINSGEPQNYGSFNCNSQSNTNQWPKLGNNVIYQMSNDTSKTGLCNTPENAFQKKYPGVDDGTMIKGPPNNAQILAQAKALIFS